MTDSMNEVLEKSSALLAHRALNSTQLLLWDLLNQQADNWADSLDDQFVLVMPHAVIHRSDTAQFEAARTYIAELLNSLHRLDALQYHIHVISSDTCGVTVSTTPSTRNFEGAPPRPDFSLYCTLIWTLHDQKITLSHCHIHAENVPASVYAEPYNRSQISGSARHPMPAKTLSRVQIRTADGQTHWVDRADITYVKACRQYTEVHCVARVLRVHLLFREVLAQLGPCVTRVHRSYAINPHFVDSIRGEMLYLTTGDKVPIPSRRIKEIRERLAREM